MRKFISTLLLVILFFQSVECLVIFKIQQLQVKYEVKHQILSNLPDSELALIKLQRDKKQNSSFSYHFFGEDEFSYSGRMYDVVRKENHGDTTWYYCYSDNEETEVLANLNDYVKNQMEHDPAKRRQRKGSQRLLLSLFPDMQQQYQTFYEPINLLCSNYSFGIKTWTQPPLTHPPQFS